MRRAALFAAVVLAGAVAGSDAPAAAQPYGRPTETERLNHDVQRLWDDTFHPRRAADRRAYERRREANRRAWCRSHADYERCGLYR